MWRRNLLLTAAFIAGIATDVAIGQIYAELWGAEDPHEILSEKIGVILKAGRWIWIYETLVIALFDLLVYLFVRRFFRRYAKAFIMGVIVSLIFSVVDFAFLDQSTAFHDR